MFSLSIINLLIFRIKILLRKNLENLESILYHIDAIYAPIWSNVVQTPVYFTFKITAKDVYIHW